MKTKEEIAHELGYKQSDSYGGVMWFKGGMFFLRLSDLPEIDKIEKIYADQSNHKIQATVCWGLLIIDGLTVKYASTDFWESVLFLCLGFVSALLMLQSAAIWRKE
jgi:hypothetical protein